MSLFDKLLAGEQLEATLELEEDLEVREKVRVLWQHHISADLEGYLSEPISFEVTPVFAVGQVLLGRFHIEAMLGSGGMGEVYLAWDARIEERVALKTIARLLTSSDAIRRRFTAEVQNARRVTHPNVCRIHELFEDGACTFFSMEYVQGVPLSEVTALDAPQALVLIRQMAEALQAAHQTGVVHGDFKPANVMIVGLGGPAPRAVIMDFGLARALDRTVGLAAGTDGEDLSFQAGTLEFMAPELRRGDRPSVRSDIYAFGKVAERLLPAGPKFKECTRENPDERPETLARVIPHLQPRSTRRYWLGGLALATTAVASYSAFRLRDGARFSLPANARVLMNGFRVNGDQSPEAKVIRSLILTALQQTNRIHVISDDDLAPSLARLGQKAVVPFAGDTLGRVLDLARAEFWLDGDVRRSEQRFSLMLRLMTGGARQLLEGSIHDEPGPIALAQAASRWIRGATGESAQSIAANPADLRLLTSSNPEALQKYYEGLEYYAAGNMSLAVPLFREAIRLDPGFAQAHSMLGMTLNGWRYDEAFREVGTALELSSKLPRHERIVIESNYYRLTEDPRKMVETAIENLADRPDEPRRHGLLAQAYSTTGRFPEAVAACQKAVELAPDDWMQVMRLEDTLVEAGRFQDALAAFRAGVARRIENKWIYNGAGSAYAGLEQYPAALAAFASQPPSPGNILDQQFVRILQGNLEVAVAALEESRSAATDPLSAFGCNQFLCALYFVQDRRAMALKILQEMAEIPVYPNMAGRFECVASWCRRLDDRETLTRVRGIASTIAQRWPNARTQAAETHAAGLDLWASNALDEAGSLLLQAVGKSYSIWTLFDLAEFYTSTARWELAAEYWAKFEEHRGTIIVKTWCPVLLILSWLQRAEVARIRSDFGLAQASSQKVLEHWQRLNPQLPVIKRAERIHSTSRTN
ncbi:protein kinase domain-containing protein [Paludibaculum fermentans]|uniref:protein kinase domain-containing protein n=1 Tax=Paludibaculum fermentans TaxID=1473598 RepID=UPI003EBFCE5C